MRDDQKVTQLENNYPISLLMHDLELVQSLDQVGIELDQTGKASSVDT
jgi:hypothetical protein